MAESIGASSGQASPAAGGAEDKRWPVAQTALFVALSSAGLWALIVAAVRWLIA